MDEADRKWCEQVAWRQYACAALQGLFAQSAHPREEPSGDPAIYARIAADFADEMLKQEQARFDSLPPLPSKAATHA